MSTMAKRSRTAAERAREADRLRTRPARARLLAAARELATARGYESIRVGDIATAAGVSRETFYTHFADKRSCLAEATEPRLGEIEIELRIAAEEEAAWAAPLLATLEATLHDRYGSRTTPRGRIIESMLALVAERGYSSVRLADVIKAAKVSYPSFYRHFANKEQCFAAVYESLIARLADRIETNVGKDSNEASRLVALAELLANDSDAARVLSIEAGLLLEWESGSRGSHLTGTLSDLLSDLIGASNAATRGALRGSQAPAHSANRIGYRSDRVGQSMVSGAFIELLRRAVLTDGLDEFPADVARLSPCLLPPDEQRRASKRASRVTRTSRRTDRIRSRDRRPVVTTRSEVTS